MKQVYLILAAMMLLCLAPMPYGYFIIKASCYILPNKSFCRLEDILYICIDENRSSRADRMILVFGGTTEGRRAVEVLEEAGKPYFYSTRSDGQEIELVNGIHLTGGMEVPEMIACCKEHDIRLIIDAAHPFAEDLHRNLLFLAKHINAAIIRYDRIYSDHDDDLTWCKDYNDALQKLEDYHIERLLALTGVNTIGRLRPFWEKHEESWFRILNRRVSRYIASANHFPEERLVYYETDDTSSLIHDLRPQAILTKESGYSGGFTEKIDAAKKAGIKVFVIERPAYPPHTPNPQHVHIEYVNGPYGLRRAVEKLLPAFFPLKSGLTTGTCATAAAVAATLQLLKKEKQPNSSLFTIHSSLTNVVPVILPNGETIEVHVGYGEGYAYCIKEAGDDPDVTNGVEVRATLTPNPSPKGEGDFITIEGGEGVGTFTLPGFDYPPGSPAINKAPWEMIRKNIMKILAQTPLSFAGGLEVRFSIPGGEEIARRTFNPRLGIEGGISIIGVSGIVKPFSEEAFIDSIRKCMTVAKASGTDRVVINSGAKSERFVKERYPDLPRQAFVEYGNYIGETLKMADELNIPNMTLGVMLGKAVKLAAGHLDTHSRKTTMDLDFIRQMLEEAGISIDLNGITLARELWERIPSDRLDAFAHIVISHCATHCRPLLPNGTLTILLIDDNGRIYL
jgi:cobalt-precorrin-5B (C1)-methyltransferase